MTLVLVVDDWSLLGESLQMEESVIVAKLTLMLLRASIPWPDALPTAYKVIVTPDSEGVSPDVAAVKMAQAAYPRVYSAEAIAGNLVVKSRAPTDVDLEMIKTTAETFRGGLRELQPHLRPESLILVLGYRDSLLVPVSAFEAWLEKVDCGDASFGLVEARPTAPAGVVAEVELGRRKSRGGKP